MAVSLTVETKFPSREIHVRYTYHSSTNFRYDVNKINNSCADLTPPSRLIKEDLSTSRVIPTVGILEYLYVFESPESYF